MQALKKNQIKRLFDIANKGYRQTIKASSWMIGFCEYNHIGQIVDNQWHIEYYDIQLILEFLESSGFSVEMFDESVLEKRGSASLYYDNEKQADAVTSNRLMVACHSKTSLNQDLLPVHRATMVTIDELLELSPSQIVVIENSETFYDISLHVNKIEHLITNDCVFVYRGGPGHSTKAILTFIGKYSGEVIAFFDYDLASLCVLNIKGIHKIILPELEQVKKRAKKLNQPHLFSNQAVQWLSQVKSISSEYPDSLLAEYCNYLIKHQFGVTQERLLETNYSFLTVKIYMRN